MSEEPSPPVRPAKLVEIPMLLFARGLLLLSSMTGAMVGLHWYLGARLIRDAAMPEPYASAAWVLLWVCFGSIFGAFLGGRLLPRSAAKIFQWLGFLWMGAFGLLVASTALTDGLLAVAAQFTTLDARWLATRAEMVAAVVLLELAWGLYASRRPLIKRVTVEIPGLDPVLEGFRIVQITDLHLGETLGGDFAQQVVEQVNALDPDLIALTGDLVDGSPAKLEHDVAPLAALRGRHGVFYVTGNHEYYHGASAWELEARRLGFTVLHNEHRVIADGKLVIGGVTDMEGARFSEAHAPRVDLAFAQAPASVPRILLAHQPRFARMAKAERPSLMLSGHTHGGQIFPFMLFVRLQQPVVSGLERIWGVQTYTSSGTGYWGPPFRIGARGEVTELCLKASSASTA